jgi:two-component system LytT family response regulator
LNPRYDDCRGRREGVTAAIRPSFGAFHHKVTEVWTAPQGAGQTSAMTTAKLIELSSARARSLGHEMAFGLPIWAAFLLALEPGNVAHPIDAGGSLGWGEETLRLAGASLLGALSTPLVLALIRRFPIQRSQLWRNLTVQAAGSAVIALGLIVVSCILAASFQIGDARPVLVALPDEINANLLLLIFCLATLSAIAHAALPLRREKPQAATAELEPAPAYITSIPVKARGRLTILDVATVDWIETQGNYLALHAGGTVHLIRESSQSFEAKLDPQHFMRVHRRTLVALNRISEMTTLANGDAALRLRDGTALKVSRSFRDKVRSSLGVSL